MFCLGTLKVDFYKPLIWNYIMSLFFPPTKLNLSKTALTRVAPLPVPFLEGIHIWNKQFQGGGDEGRASLQSSLVFRLPL